MQFISDGPDIPEALLQAHEEGRVVFFCGAGVSYPACLPGFKGLTDRIYRQAGTSPDPMEQAAYDLDQFDAALDLLERRLPGQRVSVRQALAASLKPKLAKPGALDTHRSLLHLARDRDGAVRLVTTNFDRLFEHALKRDRQTVGTYAAPMLPIPKKSRWNGIVYLHGLLPAKSDNTALNRLVVTSGDFGLAYLTERWAARFVSELFRNYVVCFVGYSINDPVLRYMMDALAADRLLGEITPEAYAFGECEPGNEGNKSVEWKAKGVTPILYKPDGGHTALHQTLAEWSATWSDGTLGKERIVMNYAIAHPSASTAQDNFVGRMLWALSHKSGLPAKRFADFNPAPTLDWLDTFIATRYTHNDLGRFGIESTNSVDDTHGFSFIARPSPSTLSQWMSLVSGKKSSGRLDDVMTQLGRWLSRHINDPKLLFWLVQCGGNLHDQFLYMINCKLDELALLERENRASEIDAIRLNSPNGIPSTPMRVLWRLLTAGRIKSPWGDADFYAWKKKLGRDGLTATLKFELRDILAPKLKISQPFDFDNARKNGNLKKFSDIVNWDLELGANHVSSAIRARPDSKWDLALPELLSEFQRLLLDALELSQEIGAAGDFVDRSHWDMPSIHPHPQNRGFHSWVTLIELTRDAWVAASARDAVQAVNVAVDWFSIRYPTFKRLALYAASQGRISSNVWVKWLLADKGWALWSVNTHREMMRLLVLRGNTLTASAQSQLESRILAGPPKSMRPSDLSTQIWKVRSEHRTWLRLAKLSKSGVRLGQDAEHRLIALSAANPRWQLTPNERDEFSHWMTGTGEPDFEESRDIVSAPRIRRDLVQWLMRGIPDNRPLYEDTWQETCKSRPFQSMYALKLLANERSWPIARWQDALSVWSHETQVKTAWQILAPTVAQMPELTLGELAHSVSWWLEAASKVVTSHTDILEKLVERILAIPLKPDSGITQNGEPLNAPLLVAINHPIGLTTRALINHWSSPGLNDNEQLPIRIRKIFTDLCDTSIDRFRHGRVILASWLITLFRVDQTWTADHLLPLLDWNSDAQEARAAWEGFLWSPRIYPPVLVEMKSSFLETTNHYNDLGEHKRQFVTFLISVALSLRDGYSTHDFQLAVGNLPQEALVDAAETLVQALESSGEQKEDYWSGRIEPFWMNIWPKSRELKSSDMTESLARLAIAANNEFPSAMTHIQHWLMPIDQPDFVVNLLYKSGLCEKFPHQSLQLIDSIISDQPWCPEDLKDCLNLIVQSDIRLRDDRRYKRLEEYARRRLRQ